MTVFADCASVDEMVSWGAVPWIRGFTTNSALLLAAGVDEYEAFARRVARLLPHLPVSFPVPSSEPDLMFAQALEIARWHPLAYVKIPAMTEDGVSLGPLVGRLQAQDVRVNVTAVFTPRQAASILEHVNPGCATILSVFAGRIADTGQDPVAAVRSVVQQAKAFAMTKVLWASPREIHNLWDAARAGSDIITLTPALLARTRHYRRDLDELARETVREFNQAADRAHLEVPTTTGERPVPA